jgi:DMSO/TMAO reductase YedYZ heme-binding membrane subunit
MAVAPKMPGIVHNMKPWHFRFARTIIYVGDGIAALAVALSAKWNKTDFGQVLVAARQLFGV